MRLHLTRKADYALRALIHLARRAGVATTKGGGDGALGVVPASGLSMSARTTIQAVAEGEGIPVRFLEKIVRELAAVGLVRSILGKNGGLELGRDPRTISFADVLEATDGPFRVAECTLHGPAVPGMSGPLAVEGTVDDDAEDAVVIGYGAGEPGQESACGAESGCRMRHVWNELQRQTDRLLRGTTLADVAFGAPVVGADPAMASAAVGMSSGLRPVATLSRAGGCGSGCGCHPHSSSAMASPVPVLG